jgi:acyl-CoA thioesterase YciA
MEREIEYITDFTVFPEDMNHAGALFGGKLLSKMDIAAATLARKILYGTAADGAVTASMDKVDFLSPSTVGDLITIKSTLKSIGKTSMIIKSKVWKETKTGEIFKICTGSFVFVAMKDSKPYVHCLSFGNIHLPEHYPNL